jgi:hypothetical protein
MTEREEAVRLAHKLLDEPWADPDDRLRLLSRQLLRSVEEADRLRKDLKVEAVRAVHPTAREPGEPSLLDPPNHPLLRRWPALAALVTTPRPEPEHVRACLLELVRHLSRE